MKKVILSQKTKFTKIPITDMAIKKIPFIEYKGFTEEENLIMLELSRLVLSTAMNENDSNEVAITCDLTLANPIDNAAIQKGKEHGVIIEEDTLSFHYLRNGNELAIVMLHNHPTNQTFSLEDIRVFLRYPSIKTMVVVTNLGKINYITKTEKYSIVAAYDLFYSVIKDISRESSLKKLYKQSKKFLSKCSNVGLYYQ